MQQQLIATTIDISFKMFYYHQRSSFLLLYIFNNYTLLVYLYVNTLIIFYVK